MSFQVSDAVSPALFCRGSLRRFCGTAFPTLEHGLKLEVNVSICYLALLLVDDR